MERKNIYLKIITVLSCFLFIFLITMVQYKEVFAENQEELVLSANENRINATINVNGSDLKLVRFKANQYHTSTDFIQNYDGIGDDNDLDGYDIDRNYYSNDVAGFLEAELNSGNTNVSINRFSQMAEDTDYDKTYDKFYIISGGTIIQERVSGGTVIAGPKNVTSFNSKYNYNRKELSSIKGLEVVNCDDAEKLGVQQSTIGLNINSLPTSADSLDAIEFTSNGKSYYFSSSALATNDDQIKRMTDAGISVTQILLIWGSSIGTNDILAHPDYEQIQGFNLNIVAANVTTEESIALYIAICEFLAERYTRPDKKYGRVENFIIGNEVESSCQWNNMGYIPIDEYIRQYERTVRLAYTAIKKTWSNANVLICCSHFWNYDVARQFLSYDAHTYQPFIDKGSFTTKQILTEFSRKSKANGDFHWILAYHPYRANAIGESIFWDQVNYEASPHNEDAPKVTPLNLDVLANYLKKPSIMYGDIVRDFYVTEYGAGTPHTGTYDPDALTEEVLNNQVASYIYSYYLIKFSGAKSYILHRQFDVSVEGGENLGIWTRVKDSQNEIYKKKPIWEVMKYIDTEYSYQYTMPYLQYITQYPSQTPATSWSDLIPNFSISELEKRPIETVKQANIVDDYEINEMVTDFENNTDNDWQLADRAVNMSVLKDSSVALNGDYGLIVQYENVGNQGGGYSEKGISQDFEDGINLSNYNKFNFSIKIEVNDNTETKHTIRVRFYNGQNIIEHQAEITPKIYNKISINVNENWNYYDNVDKIKIWYSSDNRNSSPGFLYFDDIGFYEQKSNNMLLYFIAGGVVVILVLGFLIKKKTGR